MKEVEICTESLTLNLSLIYPIDKFKILLENVDFGFGFTMISLVHKN